jgi:hypothetical protein
MNEGQNIKLTDNGQIVAKAYGSRPCAQRSTLQKKQDHRQGMKNAEMTPSLKYNARSILRPAFAFNVSTTFDSNVYVIFVKI